MHMSDALLSPAVGGAFWVGTLAALSYASKKLKQAMDDKMIPLMGVLGAFIFAGQMINFTIPGTGSSGHIGGGMLLAVLLGPYAGFIVMASVLTVQAMFFADGGLLALGANIWNLAIYPCFVAYPFIYKPLAAAGGNPRRLVLASVLSVVAALQMGAFSVVIQTLLAGRSELPFDTFVLLMQPIHLAIGLVEGFVTALVINYVRSVRPEIVDGTALYGTPLGASMKKVIVVFVAAAAVTAGVLSWFASTHPDGLEWSIEKVTGGPELPNKEHKVTSALESLQEKTAFMPDYNFKKMEGHGEQEAAAESWPAVDTGTSTAGLIGSGIVLLLIVGIAFVIRASRRMAS